MNRMSDEYKEWISNLKAGDKVAIESFGFGGGWAISTVKKVTPTGRINTEHTKFHNNGEEVGKSSTWDRATIIYPVTQEIKDNIKKKKLVRYFSQEFEFDKVDLEKLERIYQIVKSE